MHDFSKADRFKMTVWTLAMRLSFVLAVVVLALLPGVSTMMALLVVSAGLFLKSAVQIMFPAERRERPKSDRPPGGFAGDSVPRHPLPFRPSGAVGRPLPPG